MSWSYADLAAAVAALPEGTSDADAAAALAGQQDTRTGQPFTVHAAKIVAVSSPNMSWARIVQRSKQTAAIPPASQHDVAILAAITIAAMSEDQVIDPGLTAGWAAWQGGIAALQAVGDLTAEDVAALNALTTTTAPKWNPVPTEHDVAAARGLEE